MQKFILDTIGYIHDHVPRWAKITAAVLILLSVGFFFGYRAAIYLTGGVLSFATLALIVTHIFILVGNLRKKRVNVQAPFTPGDRADIEEFQAAMRGTASDTDIPPAALPPA